MSKPLEVRGVSKRYGERAVLRGVSFSLAKGSHTVLTGRSGSGKSTLFKLLAGLDRPDEGDILVDGENIAQLDDAAASQMRLRRIGLVFQQFNLLPDISVAENVRLPLDLAGAPRAAAKARALELLALVGLDAHADARPARLSGGEQQRAAIARALANAPSILIADEPTSSLDTATADAVLTHFEHINKALGVTVLIITHDPLVMERAPARLRLDDGRLLAPPAPSAPGTGPAPTASFTTVEPRRAPE